MKTKTACIAILLAIGFLTSTGIADQSCRITLSNASKIGNTEFRPGDYKLVVDVPKVIFTELKTGKSVELAAKIENVDEKFANTQIHWNHADGVRQIIEIRIGGSKTKIAFD